MKTALKILFAILLSATTKFVSLDVNLVYAVAPTSVGCIAVSNVDATDIETD